MALGIVCGYRAEERIAIEISDLTAIGWRNPDAASQLIERGATTLLSFGVAGGLDPDLHPGDLLLPEHVLVDGAYLPVSADLHGHLAARFTMARCEPMVSSNEVVATSTEKRRIFEETNAIATDMESGALAQVAIEAGVAFAIIRAVSDPVDHTLPPAARDSLTPEGHIDYGAVIMALLRDPRQLPDLIRTGQQNNLALRRLGSLIPDIRELLV